jgi:hypothetical protein
MRRYRVTITVAGQTRHEQFIGKSWWAIYQHAHCTYGKALQAVTPLRNPQAKERP